MAHCTVDIARPMVAWSIRWGKQCEQNQAQTHKIKLKAKNKTKIQTKIQIWEQSERAQSANAGHDRVCQSFRIETKQNPMKTMCGSNDCHFLIIFCRGPFMVSRLREFLMDHGHEDLIGRLQRGEITLPRAAELMNTSLTNLSGLLE